MSTEIKETVSSAQEEEKRTPRKFDWRVGLVLLLIVSSIPLYRAIHVSAKAEATPAKIFPVAVAKVTRQDLAQELVVDAELRPYQEIDLHAKVTGYLETMNVDIGDRVEAGQLLAIIEVPELADDIVRAEAMLKHSEQEVKRAQAAYEEAHLAYTRVVAVEKSQPNLIAQQELDIAQGKDRGAESTVAAAKDQVEVARAERNKLKTMLKYSRITAPFSGVITKRYGNPGALVPAGISSSQALPLVRLSQNDRLRLAFPVSVSFVSKVKLGDSVEIRVDCLQKVLTGTVARSTRKVETATRTMEVEVDVANADLQLIPGMYASVALRLERRDQALVVPVEAVSRQKSATVFVINQENKIEEHTVKLGLETPQKLQVLAGLQENDLVMIGSRTQVKPGQQVEPKLIEHPTSE
jgi:RND family efflux transporter MFP subunit